MFAFNPGNEDESGRILGQAALGAAQTTTNAQQQMVNDIGGAIMGLAGSYAESKALDAKGAAYGDFMKRHGEQLGFDPGYLEDFLKKKPREQAMIGDSIIGMQNTGRNLMSQQIVGMQMSPRAAYGTGAAASAAPQESLTF
jgi:hypothetical protein